MNNSDVRTFAKRNGVALWQIASMLGISEPTMTRKMRKELPPEEKERIFGVIMQINEGGSY